MDKSGLSDPYVKLFLLPRSRAVSKLIMIIIIYHALILVQQKFRTKTIFKNLNPTYEETFTFTGLMKDSLEKKKLWYNDICMYA